jgi:hypothetical protein
MSNNIEDLRTILFDTLRGVKNGTIDTEKAKTISEISQVIVNTAKVEVDHAKVTGSKGSGFLEKQEDKPELPNGITGIRQHRLQG